MSQAEGATEPSQGDREAWAGAAANDEQKSPSVGTWAQGQQACLAVLKGIRWHFFSANFYSALSHTLYHLILGAALR